LLYRLRIYRAVPENLELFHEFFRTRLLPVQQRHGARLVGRWATEDSRVIAVWEYDSWDDYLRIANAVKEDPDSVAAEMFRESLPSLFSDREETFMTDTLARNK
jgi:hypothetical protein